MGGAALNGESFRNLFRGYPIIGRQQIGGGVFGHMQYRLIASVLGRFVHERLCALIAGEIMTLEVRMIRPMVSVFV
jgi:hypothetical protein